MKEHIYSSDTMHHIPSYIICIREFQSSCFTHTHISFFIFSLLFHGFNVCYSVKPITSVFNFQLLNKTNSTEQNEEKVKRYIC